MADLTITVASVAAGSNAILGRGTAGTTITAGQPLYRDSADGYRLKPADANESAITAAVVGISLHAALDEQPINYIEAGDFNPGATVSVGMVYIVSSNAGGIAPVTDLAQGWYTTLLGIATTTTNIRLCIFAGGVARP